MVAEVTDPSLLVLKHQACRPKICRRSQKRSAFTGLINLHSLED
jgi:hypothetical protein